MAQLGGFDPHISSLYHPFQHHTISNNFDISTVTMKQFLWLCCSSEPHQALWLLTALSHSKFNLALARRLQFKNRGRESSRRKAAIMGKTEIVRNKRKAN